MNTVVEKTLEMWGLEGANCSFIAGRENLVYRVKSEHGKFAMRLKRVGYRSEAELLSELQWLEAMDKAGLSVPRPRPSLSGKLLENCEGQFVDMIGWLSGLPLVKSRNPLVVEDMLKAIHRVGAELARLHQACDDWEPPEGFVRCHWNVEGLLGDAPLWGRFWENPALDAETRDILNRFRQVARHDLSVLKGLDYGLIHADIVRENVLLDGDAVRILDFDDGGYGYRLFDVATVLQKNLSEPYYVDIRASLIGGYRTVRALDLSHLDLFLALRAVTYVGWIVPRIEEQGALERNRKFIAVARQLCAAYVNENHPSKNRGAS